MRVLAPFFSTALLIAGAIAAPEPLCFGDFAYFRSAAPTTQAALKTEPGFPYGTCWPWGSDTTVAAFEFGLEGKAMEHAAGKLPKGLKAIGSTSLPSRHHKYERTNS